jgi:hypothetical protein
MHSGTKISHIAPCGMNCRLCIGYVRARNNCDGCLTPNSSCSRQCTVRYCSERRGKYCNPTCESYPCTRLKNLDKRYRTKYGMSMLDNLEQIEKVGIRQFVRNENARWACPACGDLICVHRPGCLKCGTLRNGCSFWD